MTPSAATRTAALGAALALGLAGAAQAAVIFTLGNTPQQPGHQNILFATPQSGTTTITGQTNQTNTPVQFTSTQTLQTGGLGQAFFEAQTGLLTNFTFTVPGQTFTSFIFNPQIGGQPQGGGGTANVTAVANDGTFNFSYALGSGQNFLTITTADGETLSSVSLAVTGGAR